MSGTGQSRELDRQQWTPADVFDIEEAAEELGWDHDELVYNDLKRLYTKGVVKLHPDRLPEPATEEAKNAFHRWQQAWELLRAEINAGRQFISDEWDMRNGQYVFMRCEERRSAPPPAPPPAPSQPGSNKEQKQPAEEPPCKRQKTADAAGGAAAGAQDTFWQEQSVPWQEKVDFETERVRKQVDRDQLRAQYVIWRRENDEKVAEELDDSKQVLEEQTLALLRASVEQLLADVLQLLRRYVVAELLRAELAQVRKDHYWRFWMDEILSEGVAPSYVHDFAQRIAPKEDMFNVVWYVPYKIVIVISSDTDEAEDEDEDEDEDEQERGQGGSGVSASGPSAPRAPGNAPGPSAQGGSAQHHRRSSRNPVPTDRYRPIEDPRRRDPV